MTLFFLWIGSGLILIGLPMAFVAGHDHRNWQMLGIWATIIGYLITFWTMVISLASVAL